MQREYPQRESSTVAGGDIKQFLSVDLFYTFLIDQCCISVYQLMILLGQSNAMKTQSVRYRLF